MNRLLRHAKCHELQQLCNIQVKQPNREPICLYDVDPVEHRPTPCRQTTGRSYSGTYSSQVRRRWAHDARAAAAIGYKQPTLEK